MRFESLEPRIVLDSAGPSSDHQDSNGSLPRDPAAAATVAADLDASKNGFRYSSDEIDPRHAAEILSGNREFGNSRWFTAFGHQPLRMSSTGYLIAERTSADTDPRPGGSYRLHWAGPDVTLRGTYLVVERPHRVAFTWSWDHDELESDVTITLAAVDTGTRLDLVQSATSDDECDDYVAGWTEQWQQACSAEATPSRDRSVACLSLQGFHGQICSESQLAVACGF